MAGGIAHYSFLLKLRSCLIRINISSVFAILPVETLAMRSLWILRGPSQALSEQVVFTQRSYETTGVRVFMLMILIE